MPATTTEPTPVLQDGVLYLAHDRFVCSNIHCAGSTALYSGRTTDGAVLSEVDDGDVTEWADWLEAHR